MHTEQTNDNTNSIRLQVFLSHAGVCSRRHAAEIIKEGRVQINNTIEKNPGTRVEINSDIIRVDGKVYKVNNDFVYFILNKPKKVESTNISKISNDKFETPRKTVKDIIEHYFEGHIYSVGRLDYHSSGLLLFTNNGELCNRLMHPKFEVKKTYLLKTTTPFPPNILELWKKGIRIEYDTYTLEHYKYVDATTIKLVLHEGKNREIRKICEKYHLFIKSLHRIKFGPIELGSLKVGKVRRLYQSEVNMLLKCVKMPITK